MLWMFTFSALYATIGTERNGFGLPHQQRLIKSKWLHWGGKYGVHITLPCSSVDEITLSPSVGSKNQVLITVNQTLQIIGERREGEKLDGCSPASFEACWCILKCWTAFFLLRLEFWSISKLLTFSNRKIQLSGMQMRWKSSKVTMRTLLSCSWDNNDVFIHAQGEMASAPFSASPTQTCQKSIQKLFLFQSV